MPDVVILGAARTPIGSFLGQLSSVRAPQLGGAAIKAALDQSGGARQSVSQVLMGCVLPAGIGQAPARQATLDSGLSTEVGAITVNKVCGSGMATIMAGANQIRVGDADVVVAGGMESMSNSPHLLEGSRRGYRLGPGKAADHMIKDGLWDPYGDQHMGSCAELCANRYEFSREAQDAFALESYQRAQRAANEGLFAAEITAVEVKGRRGAVTSVEQDEEPFSAPLEKMGRLRPAFDPEGSVTAANASKLNDGGAALVLARADQVGDLGAKPLARLVAQASHAQEPEWFTTAPVKAITKLLAATGLGVGDIDLWEINEAFAVVTMAAIQDLELDPAKVNVHGGAVALGHPIGASGARIVVTLLHAMQQRDARRGVAAICIGGGEATAILVERDRD